MGAVVADILKVAILRMVVVHVKIKGLFLNKPFSIGSDINIQSGSRYLIK